MGWLLRNYFLPTINPSAIPVSRPILRPLGPILKQYKALLKKTTRDTSLKTKYEQAILSVMRDIERWICEAKVAANVVTEEVGWEDSPYESLHISDFKEKWALERLCDALLESGALIPSSKKCNLPLSTFAID